MAEHQQVSAGFMGIMETVWNMETVLTVGR
jgi:hypothetical protein